MVSVLYTHDIFSRQTTGGISRYFAELIRGLAGSAECHIPAGFHRNRHLADLAGVNVRGRYLDQGAAPRLLGPALRIANRARQEASLPLDRGLVVHHTYYGFLPPARRGRLIVTVHDMIPELFGAANGSPAKSAALCLAKKLTCRRADRVIAVSETTKRDLCDRYALDEGRVDVIPHGNPMERFAGFDFERPHHAPYLLYVGPRRGYKNWVALVEAFAGSRRLRETFDLVCFGGGPARPEENTLLADKGATDRVHFVQGNDEWLAAYYRHAAAYVCPSLYEGFGLPCVEAMGFGCPVVCSDRGSLPEVVGPAGIYFDPTAVASITAAIERVADDGATAAKLRPVMADRERRYRWSKTVGATLATYRRAAGEAVDRENVIRKAA